MKALSALSEYWESPGATGIGDRGTIALGSAVVNSMGIRTFALNTAGIDLVQAWIDGKKPNYGFILANAQDSDGLDFWSSDAVASTDRPRLVIKYYDAPVTSDIDGDGVADSLDNCLEVPNGPDIPDAGGNSQLDSDGDGYGNSYDPDFNGNNIVDPADFSLFRSRFGQAGFPDQDLNGNGIVDPFDFSLLKSRFGTPPGPSGLAP